MTTVESAEPLAYPAARGSCPFAPPPPYQQAQRERPVTPITLWDGSTSLLVTRHEDVRTVLRDPAFSADATHPGFPFLTRNRQVLATDVSFIRMDDPEHARLRRMLTADFMVKRTETLRPQIQRITDDFLDRMTAHHPPADLVAEFALPIPSLVICLLLGVPYEDHAFFQDRSRILLDTSAAAEEVDRAQRDLLDYLIRLAEEKRSDPDESIFGRLSARGALSSREVAAMGRLLLVAGHETTANMIGLSTLALLRDPAQQDRLRQGPDQVKAAVEELLRYLTIVHTGLPRVAIEDTVVGGHPVRAGEGVICMLSTANRDEAVFPDADGLDLSRDARRHVAFGFGVHQCLGQPLARVELQIALETLFRRLPDLRLAVPFEEIRYRKDMVVYGVHELPVAW
ncbi:cytochrome P450 [Streptomyces sp. NPDC092296]|uniref:cytochrome P450 n=1 Tax=Streptomyces sp. NPDC092296 TaxID=3366012 RepID=UPI00380C3233